MLKSLMVSLTLLGAALLFGPGPPAQALDAESSPCCVADMQFTVLGTDGCTLVPISGAKVTIGIQGQAGLIIRSTNDDGVVVFKNVPIGARVDWAMSADGWEKSFGSVLEFDPQNEYYIYTYPLGGGGEEVACRGRRGLFRARRSGCGGC